MLSITEYTYFSCSILLWPFFWLCILSFLCIKFIILSQKRVLSLFGTSKNDFKILRSTSVFFFLLFFYLYIYIYNKPINKRYSKVHFGFYSAQTTKCESHLVFLYIISYWLIRILLFLFSKNIISSYRSSCYICI